MHIPKNHTNCNCHSQPGSFFGPPQKAPPFFQRKSEAPAGPAAPAGISTDVKAQAGKGSSLPVESRSGMESAFGERLDGVSIHTDSKAVAMSEKLNAHAFTYGQDIFFNSGKYNPGKPEGDALLAHELAHTIQQKGGSEGPAQAGEYQEAEKDADSVAKEVLMGRGKKRLQLKGKKLSIQRCDGCGSGCSTGNAPKQEGGVQDAGTQDTGTQDAATQEEPANKAGRVLTADEKTRITQILTQAGMPTGTSTLTATTGVKFVLHDTASSPSAARLAELQRTSHAQMGEAAAAYVPDAGDAAVARTGFYDANRPTATESEKANDILGETQRFSLSRSIWKNTNAAHKQTAINAAAASLTGKEATGEQAAARKQLEASRGKIMTTGLWAVREICRMVAAETATAVAVDPAAAVSLQKDCTAINPFFAARTERMSDSVNVEIIKEAGSDCRTTDAQVKAHNDDIRRQIKVAEDKHNAKRVAELTKTLIPGDKLVQQAPYSENQYLNVGKLYLNAALQAGQYPEITTHFLVDKVAGDHCDPRCFNLGHLYNGIAKAMGHRPDSTYGIVPDYGTGSANNLWWNDTACGGSHP